MYSRLWFVKNINFLNKRKFYGKNHKDSVHQNGVGDALNETTRTEMLAEYSGLRNEIVTLQKERLQIVLITLALLGAILSFATKNDDPDILALLTYPIICSFFAFGWSHIHFRIGEIGNYIKDNIEKNLKGLNWENCISDNSKYFFRGQEPFAKGVFIGTQIITILLAIFSILPEYSLANGSITKTPNHANTGISIIYPILLFFDILSITITWRVITKRRKNLKRLYQVNIATPIVWENSDIIDEFVSKIYALKKSINETAQKLEIPIKIKKASIDIFSGAPQNIIKKKNKEVHINFENIDQKIRIDKGMANWWYQSIKNAFDLADPIDAVLYFPIDTCWDNNDSNTVSNPLKLLSMIKEIIGKNNESIIIGNYKSSNETKDQIEKTIFKLVESKFSKIDKDLQRVRSEYFLISRSLFKRIEKIYDIFSEYYKVDDPTLFIVLYCLNNSKEIIPYNLGYYNVDGEWDDIKAQNQISRANKLITNYLQLQDIL